MPVYDLDTFRKWMLGDSGSPEEGSDPRSIAADVLSVGGALGGLLWVYRMDRGGWTLVVSGALILGALGSSSGPPLLTLLGFFLLAYVTIRTQALIYSVDLRHEIWLFAGVFYGGMSFFGFLLLVGGLLTFLEPRSWPDASVAMFCLASAGLLAPLFATMIFGEARALDRRSDLLHGAFIGSLRHPPWERALTRYRALQMIGSLTASLLVLPFFYQVVPSNLPGLTGWWVAHLSATLILVLGVSAFAATWTVHLLATDPQRVASWSAAESEFQQ